MARLQILELPQGPDDDRPPFILVIDEISDNETDRLLDSREATDGIAKKIGAQAVAAFHGMTVDIPANKPPLAAGTDDAEGAGATAIVYAHERTRLDLCDALLLSRDTTWRQLVEEASQRQRAVARVLDLPEQPQAMAAGHPPMEDYLHGYGVGVRAAKRAASDVPVRLAQDGV
ncbi:hypothetical protein [Streptomyces naphthomycinicus]|uniref:hypothetical protein n=1 Tax=Streptomyces naphthomycinicus TaxID=2872625 RepID=UPI001CED3557|nr:hypothetical protein [Streptomyces sp. TML10]